MSEQLVEASTLATWLDVSGHELYELGKQGIVVRHGKHYALQASVRGYIAHLRSCVDDLNKKQ
jgi:hypothetical protein